jgi:hypothetical protein
VSKVARKVSRPWQFVEPSLDEARALQALAVGEASPEQQKKALAWIIHRACGASLDTFEPGQPDVSSYRQGRRAVGVLITQVLITKPENLRRQGETDE